eukprot:5725050-Alexandrium_andersonii.AAC.1
MNTDFPGTQTKPLPKQREAMGNQDGGSARSDRHATEGTSRDCQHVGRNEGVGPRATGNPKR